MSELILSIHLHSCSHIPALLISLASTVLIGAYLLRKRKLILHKYIHLSGFSSTTTTDAVMSLSYPAHFPLASSGWLIGMIHVCLLAVHITWNSLVPAGLELPS